MDDSAAGMYITDIFQPHSVGMFDFNANENLLGIVLEKLSIGVILLDYQGVILYYNSMAATTLLTLSNKKKWVDIINGEIESSDLQLDTLCLKNKKTIRLRTQSLTPYPGQLICILDVTEHINLHNHFLHQQRLVTLGKMAAKIAHQIRTPLSTALLYVKNLIDFKDKTDDAQKSKFLDNIYHSLNHIEAQIRDMLLFAKGTSIVKKNVHITELIFSLKEANLKNNVSFKLDHEVNDIDVFCNTDLLLGAIQGCINNAIESQKNKDPICLAVLKNKEFVEIQIHDQGEGIPDNLKEKIFEAFFTTKEKGTGLGLSIAELVIKAHGGILDIKSKNGHGTTVTFKLPVNLE